MLLSNLEKLVNDFWGSQYVIEAVASDTSDES